MTSETDKPSASGKKKDAIQGTLVRPEGKSEEALRAAANQLYEALMKAMEEAEEKAQGEAEEASESE